MDHPIEIEFRVISFFSIIFLLLFTSHPVISQRLTVIPVHYQNQPFLVSPPNYGEKNLDVVWNISFPAEISITQYFDIDNQAGEFMVIGEYPLPNEERFSDGAAAEDVISDLPLEKSVLLTSDILEQDTDNEGQYRLTLQITNELGGLIYFHGLQRDLVEDPGIGSTTPIPAPNFQGFNINITYLDLNPTSPPTTTTESPPAGEDVYLRKYLSGLSPIEFLRVLDPVRGAFAEMANKYCEEENIALIRPIESSEEHEDVRLDNRTTFFCNSKLRYELNQYCVEIMVAILGREVSGHYAMTTDRLESMWNRFAVEYLRGVSPSLRPYEPDEPPPMDTWIWVAGFLGVILVMVVLLTYLINRSPSRNRQQSSRNSSVSQGADSGVGSHASDQATTFDAHHPLNPILKSIYKKREQDDKEYLDMIGRDVSNKDSISSSRTNPLYHIQGFDNGAFLNDEPDYKPHFVPSHSGSRAQSQGRSSQGTTPVEVYTAPPSNGSDSEEEDDTIPGETPTGLAYA